MCGRFNVIDNPELQSLLRSLGIDLGLPTRCNIAPTESITVVRELEGERSAFAARWWLTPRWAKAVDTRYAMFNARCETLAESRAFKIPFQRQRGIVPLSSFIEWRKEGVGKQPYLIENQDGEALAVAALWESWHGADQTVESCTLVTTAAAAEFVHLHHRMPVVLVASERERWLDSTVALAPDDPLFAPRQKTPWAIRPLSQEVNNARNKSAELMKSQLQ